MTSALPSVVVLLLDTLRYDYARQIELFDDAANKGWFFERIYGGSTFTFPNLCTLRSGMYPHHHGWRTFPHHDPFRAETTLCDNLQKAGYYIATTLEAPPADETLLLERPRPTQEPFFRFCWFTGIHDCVFAWECKGVPQARYTECVQTCTEWLEEALNKFKDCLILLFGDHGVGLRGDRLREEGHDVGAGQVYDFRIRLPCVLLGPMLGPRVISEAYSLADLMPTILHLLGLPIPEGLDGRVVDHRDEPVLLEAQSPHSIWPSPVPNVFGATDGRIKVMITPEGWRAYDLLNDPSEKDERPDLLDTSMGHILMEIIKDRVLDGAD